MVKNSDKLNAVVKLIRHFIISRHSKGHGIHSPAVFEFVSEVLFCRTSDEEVFPVINLVEKMRLNEIVLDFQEYGAGSFRMKGNRRKLNEIVRYAGVSKKYGKLLYRIARHYRPATLLELGTSVGVSTLYLGYGLNPETKFITVEINQSLADIARQNAAQLGLQRIHFVNQTFEQALSDILPALKSPVVAFIDGNHTYTSTIQYFNLIAQHISEGLIIIGDIYWSKEMDRAWKKIQNESIVSIDLYQVGIVIIGDLLTPGKYRIRF